MGNYEDANGPWIPPYEDERNNPMHSSGPSPKGGASQPTSRPRRNSRLTCQCITPEMEDREPAVQTTYHDTHRPLAHRLVEGFAMLFADGDG